MKKTLLLVLPITLIILIALFDVNSTGAYASAPPVSHAGAPLDNSGLTCAKSGCHTGSAITQTAGVIAHNIPGSGFIGGSTYTFSVTMSGASAYGFQLTPQSPTSNAGLGTWIAGAGTSVSTKYIRQSAKKTGATAVWTFSWTAPTTATAVTFYGAFNYANNNGGTSGDVIKTSSVTVMASTTGVDEQNITNAMFTVFPNPTTDVIHITLNDELQSASIYALDGKLVKTVSSDELQTKTISISHLNNGLYYLQVSKDGKNYLSKITKQ